MEQRPEEARKVQLKDQSIRSQQRWRKSVGQANPPGRPHSSVPIEDSSIRNQQRVLKAADLANPPGHPLSSMPVEDLSIRAQNKRRKAAGIANRRGRPLTVEDNHTTVKAHLEKSLNEDDRRLIREWNLEFRLIVHAVVCDECNQQKTKWRDAAAGDVRQQAAEDYEDNSELADEALGIQLAGEEATDNSAESLDALLAEFVQAEFKDEGVSIRMIRERFMRDREKPLGKGANKVVRQCRDLATGTKVAVGEIKQPFNDDSDEKREFLAEVKMMLSVTKANCPNIVRFICHSIETVDPEAKLQRGWLVSEALEGDLRQCAKLKDGPLETETAKLWLTEIIQAVAWLHEKGIMHRDLKWNNIFITKCGHARVGDFGYAKEGAPAADKGFFQTWLGTVGNIAPEVYIGPYTKAADIYAWGMTMLSIFTKKDPYDGEFSKAASKAKLDEKAKEEQRAKEDEYMEAKCLAGQRPAGWQKAFDINGREEYELSMLFKRCTKFIPSSRFEADDLVHHPALMPSNGTHVRRLNRIRFTHIDREDDEDTRLLFQIELLERPGSKPLVIGLDDGTIEMVREEVQDNPTFDSLRANQKESLVEKLYGYLRISKRERDLATSADSDKFDPALEAARRRHLTKELKDRKAAEEFIANEDDFNRDASNEPRNLQAARKLILNRWEQRVSKTAVKEKSMPSPMKTPTTREIEARASLDARVMALWSCQPPPRENKPKKGIADELSEMLAEVADAAVTSSSSRSDRNRKAAARVGSSSGTSKQSASSGTDFLGQALSGLQLQKEKPAKLSTKIHSSGSTRSSVSQEPSARGTTDPVQQTPKKTKQKSAMPQLA